MAVCLANVEEHLLDELFIQVKVAMCAILCVILIFQSAVLASYHEMVGCWNDKRDHAYIGGGKYMKISNLILLVALGIATIGIIVTWDWPNS